MICHIFGTLNLLEPKYSDKDQEFVSITHDNKILLSTNEASRVQTETFSNLKGQKKLIFIIDLDQTLLHATVDPQVSEWMEKYPQHPVVKDIHAFKLKDSPNFTYFIKLRPGVREFLKQLESKFEYHVYTMGSRNYAEAVVKVIDPNGSLFADRILSRDESGSFSHKNISRLFPQDQSMVVILDDRADVWQYSPNLIRIKPCKISLSLGSTYNFLSFLRLARLIISIICSSRLLFRWDGWY